MGSSILIGVLRVGIISVFPFILPPQVVGVAVVPRYFVILHFVDEVPAPSLGNIIHKLILLVLRLFASPEEYCLG